jgi:hypothetical protein
LTVIGVTCAVPTAADGIVPITTDVGVAEPAALAGATDDRTPIPKAATATSATRLKVVFVDICFLSISRSRESLPFGLELKFLTQFDESHVLIHQIPHRVSGRGEETYF